MEEYRQRSDVEKKGRGKVEKKSTEHPNTHRNRKTGEDHKAS